MIWNAKKLSDRQYHRRRAVMSLIAVFGASLAVAANIWASTWKPIGTRDLVVTVWWTVFATYFALQARSEWLESKKHG